ncbi:MAG: 6-phosphogluconolactonase [Phycisphaerales bacterium]
MADAYELDARPTPPPLPGSVVVRSSVDELIDAIAADLMVHAMNCVRAFGDFHVALSGGSTPLPLYRRLMYDPNYRSLPWARTHLWVVDERRVPFDDEKSNFRSISETIGDHSGIPPEQVHPIFAQADDADTAYEASLRETLAWREPGHDRLDYVLLGMGTDAHTASLFPHSPALVAETDEIRRAEVMSSQGRVGIDTTADDAAPPRLVRINAGANVTPPDRVTMTLRLINASRFIGVMVTGASKRATLARVMTQQRPATADVIEQYPILGIRPIGGVQRWYLDAEACPPVPA